MTYIPDYRAPGRQRIYCGPKKYRTSGYSRTVSINMRNGDFEALKAIKEKYRISSTTTLARVFLLEIMRRPGLWDELLEEVRCL